MTCPGRMATSLGSGGRKKISGEVLSDVDRKNRGRSHRKSIRSRIAMQGSDERREGKTGNLKKKKVRVRKEKDYIGPSKT